MGILVDYKRELLLAFGDYEEAYETMENTPEHIVWLVKPCTQSGMHLACGSFGK